MTELLRALGCLRSCCAALVVVSSATQVCAQTEAVPPAESAPPPDPPYAAPTAEPAPAPGPSAAPGSPAPAPTPQPAPSPAYPAPATGAQPPASTPAPAAPVYAAEPPASPAYEPTAKSSPVEIPDFSVRIDPLNWILYGQLGVELELEFLEWLSIEAVPVFVVSEQPVVFNVADDIFQKSDGLGPLSGVSLGLGFWLDGDTFNGSVLRAGFAINNMAYRSEALEDDASLGVLRGDVFDEVTLRERKLSFHFGSHRTWGFFTLAGGIGLDYELRDDRRCIAQTGSVWLAETDSESCTDDDAYELARGPVGTTVEPPTANVFGALHPFAITGRLSLGFVLDD